MLDTLIFLYGYDHIRVDRILTVEANKGHVVCHHPPAPKTPDVTCVPLAGMTGIAVIDPVLESVEDWLRHSLGYRELCEGVEEI